MPDYKSGIIFLYYSISSTYTRMLLLMAFINDTNDLAIDYKKE